MSLISARSPQPEGNYTLYKYLNDFDGLLGFRPYFGLDSLRVSSIGLISVTSPESLSLGSGQSYIIRPDGSTVQSLLPTEIFDKALTDGFIASSVLGTYQAICDFTNGQISIFKNGVLLQTMVSPLTMFSQIDTIAMSADGHYLVIHGTNNAGSNDHIEIWEGSALPQSPPLKPLSAFASQTMVNPQQSATLSATSETGGTPPYTYQWFEKTPSLWYWTAINGADSPSWKFSADNTTPLGAFQFILQVVDSNGFATFSNVISVQVLNVIVQSAEWHNITGDAISLTLNPVAKGDWVVAAVNVWYTGGTISAVITSDTGDPFILDSIASGGTGNIQSIIGHFVSPSGTKFTATFSGGVGGPALQQIAAWEVSKVTGVGNVAASTNWTTSISTASTPFSPTSIIFSAAAISLGLDIGKLTKKGIGWTVNVIDSTNYSGLGNAGVGYSLTETSPTTFLWVDTLWAVWTDVGVEYIF